jgi:hypothetical protein
MLVMTSSASAFDRQRPGLVFGMGLGLSPISTLSSSYTGHNFSGSGTGLGINMMLGYGISKHYVLAIEWNQTAYRSDYNGENAVHYNVIAALTWSRYYGEVGKSYLLLAGAGVYSARSFSGISFDFGGPMSDDEPEARTTDNWGLGLICGVGRELTTRVQLVGYGAVGFPPGDVYIPAAGHASNRITAVHFSINLMYVIF